MSRVEITNATKNMIATGLACPMIVCVCGMLSSHLFYDFFDELIILHIRPPDVDAGTHPRSQNRPDGNGDPDRGGPVRAHLLGEVGLVVRDQGNEPEIEH